MTVNLADLNEAAAALYNVGDKRLCAVLRATEIEIASLRAALKPFADQADEVERMASQTDTSVEEWAKTCPWDDLVRARDALA